MRNYLIAGALGAMLLFSAKTADAAVVQFGGDGWVNQNSDAIAISATATFTDELGGVLFDLLISGFSAVTGDILKIGIDGLTFGTADISSPSTNTGDAVSVLCNDCDGQPNGFNGGIFDSAPYDAFDTIVLVGGNGSSSGNNTAISFFIDGVSAEDAEAVALRIQSTNTPGGSLKLVNDMPTEVPLPAAGLLLLAGLGGLGLMRRLK